MIKLKSIRVVLIATTHPGNIGSAARAMKTMGLERLYLVLPKHFPHLKAYELAAGAEDILTRAVVTASLQEAIQGCHLVFGTSARPREIALPGLTPAQCAKQIHAQQDTTEVAVLFGREHAGLTNEELLQCHYHVNIPSNPEYASLNLAQAVQIIAYELRMHACLPKVHFELQANRAATAEEVEQFYTHLKEVLIDLQFLKPSNPKKLMQRLRRLFSRIQLEQKEVNILRGILTHIKRATRTAAVSQPHKENE